MKRIFLICLCAVSALAVWAQNERPIVTIETSMGEMVVEPFNETPLHHSQPRVGWYLGWREGCG